MDELLSKIQPEHLIGLVAVIGAFASGIVAIVMGVGLRGPPRGTRGRS